MSEVSGQKKSDLELPSAFDEMESLSAEQVAQHLLNHPNFFVQHPNLLARMDVPHAQKGTVSLVELQSEQLRKKVRQLNHKLGQLISIAKQNEEIYRIYADLNLRILRCEDVSDLQLTLEEVLQDQLRLSSVSLKPFSGAHAFPEIQQRLFIEKRFKQEQFFFGRLSEHERKLLFADQAAESVALLLLGERGELGILAIGSKDSGHFHPEMDTLLITQLQQFLSILLPKMLTY
jgi:uncharacterized protein YigA (DUF484 family)